MLKKIKKAFTLVELVVVIAVIAILAALSVVSYIGVTNKAKAAADSEIITQLNTQMRSKSIMEGPNKTAYEAYLDAREIGFNLELMKPSSNGKFVWDQSTDLFACVEVNKDNKTLGKVIAEDKSKKFVNNAEKNWVFTPEINSQAEYCQYLNSKDKNENLIQAVNPVVVKSGFDAGENYTVTEVKYDRSNETVKKEVTIRTSDFATKLSVNAPLDTVFHYGNTSLVDIISIHNASYHYYNTLGRLKVEKGHAVGEPGSAVITPMDMDGDAKGASIDIKKGAKVYTEGEYVKLENGVAAQHVEDCGAGHHDFGEKIVVDNHVYELCKCCGYTLITGQDKLGNETKQSKNSITTDETGKKTVVENVTPMLTYEIESFVSSSTAAGTNYEIAKDEEGKEKVLSEEIKSIDFNEEQQTCDHNFISQVIVEPSCIHTGLKAFVCDKCGASYNVTLSKTPHKYYDHKIGSEYSGEDVCDYCGFKRSDFGENVCKIENKEYKTLSLALADVPTDGTLTKIVLNNDDAIKAKDDVAASQNGCWEIKAGQNVVIDLNGYTLKNLVTCEGYSEVIKNNGTLTIMDSSDINKNGTGTGMIFNDHIEGISVGEWWDADHNPGYKNFSTNVITNRGECTIQSGNLYNTAAGTICFVVDNFGTLNINGGHLHRDYGSTIRLYSSYASPILNMKGGKVTNNGGVALYPQVSTKDPCTINIDGGEISSTGDAIYVYYDFKDGGNHVITLNVTGGNFSGNFFLDDGWGGTYGNITGGTFRIVGPYYITWAYGTGDEYYGYGDTHPGYPNYYSIEYLEANGYITGEYSGYSLSQYFKYYSNNVSDSPLLNYIAEGCTLVPLGSDLYTVEKAQYIVSYQSKAGSYYCWASYNNKDDADEELASFIEGYGPETEYGSPWQEVITPYYAMVYTYKGENYAFFKTEQEALDAKTAFENVNGTDYNARVITWYED